MYQIALVIRKKKKKRKKKKIDRIYSIDAFSIASLKEFLLLGLPNKRVLTILSSFSVKMFASIEAILSKRVCL